MIAAETMTELQLRLWCLWMCDRYAEIGGARASWYEAMRGVDKDTRNRATALDQMAWHTVADSQYPPHKVSLLAWQLSERMP